MTDDTLMHFRLVHQNAPASKHTFWCIRHGDLAVGEGMMDLYTALQPHVTEAAARAAAAAAAEQQAAQDDAEAAASRDKQISLTLMGLPNVVRSKRHNVIRSRVHCSSVSSMSHSITPLGCVNSDCSPVAGQVDAEQQAVGFRAQPDGPRARAHPRCGEGEDHIFSDAARQWACCCFEVGHRHGFMHLSAGYAAVRRLYHQVGGHSGLDAQAPPGAV